MEFELNRTQQDIQKAVRDFTKGEFDKDLAMELEEAHAFPTKIWQKAGDLGLLGVHFPEEYSGQGLGCLEDILVIEELCRGDSTIGSAVALSVFASELILHNGSEAQKQAWLPKVAEAQVLSAGAFTEPDHGSDITRMNTTAVKDGNEWVINGTKTWTTLGHWADWIFCLVRTDPEAQQQRGISFLLIDMSTPGISVRPIITLDGDHEVNEVFFDNVRVPVENLVGEENQGWTCAKYLLTHERTGLAGIGASKAALAHLKRIAMKEVCDGKPMLEDPLFRAQVAEVEMQLMAIEMSTLRILAAAKEGGVPGAESSILKVKGTEIRQAITSLLRKVIGPYALPFLEEELQLDYDGELLHADYSASLAGDYFNMRKLSIFGGSNEIQKNIVSKMILEL